MENSRLSTKGQLVIPAPIRKAMNLRPGDDVELTLVAEGLLLRRKSEPRAKLKRGKYGHLVLAAPDGAPAMTIDRVNLLRDELP